MGRHVRDSPGKIIVERFRGVLVTVLCMLVLSWLDYQGWFSPQNGRLFDMILRSRNTGQESPASRSIVRLEIDDEAYQKCFAATSPMEPKRVFNLVKQVADANPKTIGVAIRTESDEYSRHIPELDEYASSIVWMAAFDRGHPQVHEASFFGWLLGDSDFTAVAPGHVLGMSPFDLPRRLQTSWGIPLYPRDEDGRVRRFPRSVHLAASEGQSGGIVASWASRVADVYCRPECTAESADEIYISYAGQACSEYKLQEVFSCPSDLTDFNGRQDKNHHGPKYEEFRKNVLGRIVLIGATYDEPSNVFPTPKGMRPGLFVNTYAVKADLDGNGFVELRQPLAWMLDVLLGLLIVAVTDEKFLRAFQDSHTPEWLSGWKRKKIIFSTLIVVVFCGSSLFVAHGRYLLGFAGEAAGVIVDRMRDLWDFTKAPSKRKVT